MRAHNLTLATALVAALVVSGCRIDDKKSGNGDDVKIATPFGGMSVKTDDSSVAQSTGIPLYPGATPEVTKDKDGKNNGSADINMSFGSFQLRVKAASFQSTDPPEKILAFYKKSLTRFGPVIQCKDHHPVGSPTRTPGGLDCSDDDRHTNGVNVNDDLSGKTELKVGSRQHQHIVGLDPDGTGTKIGLVALDLPGHFNFGNDKDGKKNTDDSDDSDKDGDKDGGKQ
jgi:hypothetical protein